MKRFFILLSLVLLIVPCRAANLNVEVDQRCELTSIVFRLAGAEEFSADRVPSYIKDVDSYFSKYSSHPLINYLKEVRRENENVGFSIAAASAFMFNIEDGRLIFDIKEDSQSVIQKYWPYKSLKKYLQLLAAFYVDTDFNKFWLSQQPRVRKSIEYAEKLILDMNLNIQWLESFFNEEVRNFTIGISMLNGSCNYGNIASPSYDGVGKCILLGCGTEIEGVPALYDDIENVLLHEMCHCLGNRIFFEYEDDLMPSFKMIYPNIREIGEQHGYKDANAVACESLIELFTLLYMKDSNALWYDWNVAGCEERGYFWMSDMIRFMDNFSSNRSMYPSVKEFMPQLVAYYNELPDRFDAIMLNNKAKSPYIESTYPAKGSVVSCDLKEIRINLSHPVIDAFAKKSIDGLEPIPHDAMVQRTDDHRTIIIPMDKRLKENKTYGMSINGNFIVAEDTHHRMTGEYQLIFKTK